MSLNQTTLDGTCSSCLNKGTYLMEAVCSNCGTHSVIELSKTHQHPSWGSGPSCPICGVRYWTGWTLVGVTK